MKRKKKESLIVAIICVLAFPLSAKAQTFKERVVSKAIQEWQQFYNRPIVVTNKLQTDELSKKHLEYKKCQVVDKYWKAVKMPPKGSFCLLQGRVDLWNYNPWSAVFISYIMQHSGVKIFKYTSHSAYIIDSVKKRDDINHSFRGYPINEVEPEIGDLICAPRNKNIDMQYSDIAKSNGFKSHCDIVVAKDGNRLEAIGGNVGDSVAKTIVSLDSSGHIEIKDQNFRPWFVVIKNTVSP